MKIRIWIAVRDGGDGEHPVSLYPSRERLVEDLKLDDKGFEPGWDVPVEIQFQDIELNDYLSQS